MATITANRRPISRYRARVTERQLPPIPPQWLPPARAWRAPPPLSHFVLLSVLLHGLLIALFGAPSGGNPEGRAMWGSMQVELRGLLVDSGRAPLPTPRADERESIEATPVPSRKDRGAQEGAVPMTAPAETQAAAVAPVGPRIVEVPAPFPRLLDRLASPEPRLVEPPPLKVPPPTEGRDLRPPPRERPLPAPVEVPAPITLTPEARSERALADPPAIAAPFLQPVPDPLPEPVVAPPRAPSTAEAPAAPETRPAEAPPIEVRAIPAPPLESLDPPAGEVPRPIEMAPLPEIQAAPPPPAFERAPSQRSPPAAVEPRLPRGPDLRVPDAPGATPRAGRQTPSTDYDPTAPALDLDAIRERAGQIAREGSGQRALLPFPMPPVPEKKSKMQTAIENARKPDCRTAYQGLGLAAIVPLIANEFGEGKCRW